VPDFERGLIGLKAGDETQFDVTFPDDYPEAKLAGQTARFDVSVREVAEQVLPDVDEEFVRSFGVESGTVDDFRADVRANMEREAAVKVRAEVKRQVMEGLLEANPVEVPAVLVDEEAQSLRSDALRRAGVEDGPQAPGVDAFREAAARRVRLGLLIGALISEHRLEADRARVQAKVEELCAPYEQPEELAKMYLQNPQLLSQVENMVLEDQVVDWLLERAQVTGETHGFREFMES